MKPYWILIIGMISFDFSFKIALLVVSIIVLLLIMFNIGKIISSIKGFGNMIISEAENDLGDDWFTWKNINK